MFSSLISQVNKGLYYYKVYVKSDDVFSVYTLLESVF